MSNVPDRDDMARVATDEERAENARRHDQARRALYPEPAMPESAAGECARCAELEELLDDAQRALVRVGGSATAAVARISTERGVRLAPPAPKRRRWWQRRSASLAPVGPVVASAEGGVR